MLVYHELKKHLGINYSQNLFKTIFNVLINVLFLFNIFN